MSTVQGRLRIAIQKSGRLSERSLDLVRDAGLRVIKGNNDLLYRVENYPIDLLRVRDDDIPTFVADGVCDLGIVGKMCWRRSATAARPPRCLCRWASAAAP